MENRSRRNNLRIDGVSESNSETWNDCVSIVKNIFKNQLGIAEDIVVERAHRVGQVKEDKPRTIILKLLNFHEKSKILSLAKKLKGSGVFINKDYANETLEKRKKLWEEIKRHRKEGKFAIIKYDKIFVREFRK